MRFMSLGGAREVCGSCHLLEIGGKRILMDAGVRPMKARYSGFKDCLPDLARLPHIDAVCISHAHLDHLAALPMIMRRFPDVFCFMSVPTFPIMARMLLDFTNTFALKDDEEVYAGYYAPESIERITDRILTSKFDQPFQPFRNHSLTMTFKRAGHILGAAGILVEHAEETAFYTGDFCGIDQRTLPDADFSDVSPDLLITETTYGSRNHLNRQQAEKESIDKVAMVLAYGGRVLFPTFALGRAQEVILALQHAQAQNRLPPVPIFVDGLVRDICALYEEMVRPGLFYGEGRPGKVIRVEDHETRKFVLGGPCIVVASSGHLAGGPSVSYAKEILPNPQDALVITAYADEETVTGRISNLKMGDTLILEDKQITVKADIIPMYLSAHADQGQLLTMMRDMEPPNVIGVHGELESGQALEAAARADGWKGKFWIPEIGETVDVHK